MPKQIADEQIFTAVVDVLLEQGYAGATTRLIAERAGVNEVTLFRKYGSKAALVKEALAFERRQLEAIPLDYTGDFAADVGALLSLFQTATPRQAQLFFVSIAATVRFPELREALQVPMRTVLRLANLLRSYQERGVLQAGEPLLMVGALLHPVIMHTVLRAVDPDLPLPPLDLQEHVARFLDGYAR